MLPPQIGKKSPGGGMTAALVARSPGGRRGVGRAEAARRGSGETMIQAPSCRVLFASGGHAPRLGQITQRKLVTPAAGSLDKVKVIAGGDAASLPPSRDRRVRHPKVGSEQGKRWPYADDLFHAADYAFCMARSQCPMHSDQ